MKSKGHALGAPETRREARIPKRWTSFAACSCGITLTGVSPASPVDAYDKLLSVFERHVVDAGPRSAPT